NDLVTLAQSNSTDFISTKPTDIAALMQDITAKAAALGDRDWSLKANADGEVSIDGPRLTQAMLQLCANAVQFSEPGSPIELGSTIRLSIAGDTELCLWVAEAGIGISTEVQPAICTRDGRGANGKRTQGSGPGLHILE